MMQPICCDCSQLKLSEQGQRQDLIHSVDYIDSFHRGMSASKAVDISSITDMLLFYELHVGSHVRCD